MMNEKDKEELLRLAEILEERKRDYGIMGTKLQPHQKLLEEAITETRVVKEGKKDVTLPKNKYILYQGGNGSGKSFTGLYVTVLLALGLDGKKYGLPYIGSKVDIWIVTKSGANITSTIGPYLLGAYSRTGIPKPEIDKINQDNGIIKSIKLKNGCTISIRTYDQGRERIQGGSPDFMLVDEEPTQASVWNELIPRVRKPNSQMVLTMTPLSGLTPVYSFFYEQQEQLVKDISKVILVSSLDNIYADHTGLLGLSEQEKKMRIYGLFVPPSGLVYSSFIRNKHVIKHISPNDIGEGVKYYGAIDFGHTHPTAFLFIAIDLDGNIYIFDMIYQSGMLIREIAEMILKKKREYGIDFEYIVADSAAKRERIEIAQYGIKTQGADKWGKGENGESNRKSGIFKVNQLLADGKIFISDRCRDLVTEFEQHHYKDNGSKDGEVEKTQDDALDALRYFIFSYKVKTTKELLKEKFKNKYGVPYNGLHRYGQYNNPY